MICKIYTLNFSKYSNFSTEAIRHFMEISPLTVLVSECFSLSISSLNFTGSADNLMGSVSSFRCTKGSLNNIPTSMPLSGKYADCVLITGLSGKDKCFFKLVS
jgi:hypothetical protein